MMESKRLQSIVDVIQSDRTAPWEFPKESQVTTSSMLQCNPYHIQHSHKSQDTPID